MATEAGVSSVRRAGDPTIGSTGSTAATVTRLGRPRPAIIEAWTRRRRPQSPPLRLRLDWRNGLYVVLAVVGALAVIAVISNSTAMLTRIGIGILIALALDPLADSLQRRFSLNRALAVTILAVGLLGIAGLLGVVLGPRAVAEAGRFSDQLPQTIDEIEELPLIGAGPATTTSPRRSRSGCASCPSR